MRERSETLTGVPNSGAVPEPETVRPLHGSRRLRPEDIEFSDEVCDTGENLNFYIPCWFHVDEVFGTQVETPDSDDSLNIYANYDLESGQVRGTLDITLRRADGTEDAFVYHLNAEEKAMLLPKMDAYCRKETGHDLSRFRAMYLRERGREPGKNERERITPSKAPGLRPKRRKNPER